MSRRVIYYSDELNDEFAGDNIKAKKIDSSYVYIHKSVIKKLTKFFWYRVVATPIAYLYLKLKYRNIIINKKILKAAKQTGYFLYGNHTNNIGDAFIPTKLAFPKDVYVIVHPNNVSMPYLGRITPSLGALPLPDDYQATKNFFQAIKLRSEQKHCITVYPEAHIWPYYTKIRPFKETSFRFPIEHNKPVYVFTNTYQKRRDPKKVQLVTYLDGPFYAQAHLTTKENMTYLRNQAYEVMVKRSKNNTVELIKYIKKEGNNND